MASSLIRTSAVRGTLRSALHPRNTRTNTVLRSAPSRSKATLPELPYAYNALEPYISSQIMTLHHTGHHATYVKSLNDASDRYAAASDTPTQVALLPLLHFHGGGHVNHSLFWENLAPKTAGGGSPPSGRLATAIDSTFGSYDKMRAVFVKALAALQGSGWVWLVQDKETGALSVRPYANQDPVVAGFRPLLGIDAWEHAYYLDYQNRKAEYFERVWEVVKWEKAAERME